MDVNAKGVYHCLRAELSIMKSGASIDSAASIAGLRGIPTSGPYVANKFAVVGMTRVAA
jgi:NAD(P)-dependent dehydrogenase (short-subunit alcohol dehydrogenase family)